MAYKKSTLNPDLLSYLFLAFQRKLFVTPREGDILSVSNPDSSCTLYFKADYHSRLSDDIMRAASTGAFARSNNYDGWMELASHIVNGAVDSSAPDYYEDYYTNVKMFIG